MLVDELFSVNSPDGFIENAHTVGRLRAYICRICGAYVAHDYLVAHTEIHNKQEQSEKDIHVLRTTTKVYGDW
jgi:hypothetical protein